jgi:hypothetical protein
MTSDTSPQPISPLRARMQLRGGMRQPKHLPGEGDARGSTGASFPACLIGPGDVVTVTRLDRLASSTFDLFAHRQADRGREGAISITGRAVGRHRHQHRAIGLRKPRLADAERDTCRTRP